MENNEGLRVGDGSEQVVSCVSVDPVMGHDGRNGSATRTSDGYKVVVVAKHDRTCRFVDTNNSKSCYSVVRGLGYSFWHERAN
jgi:hypothetical protein